MHFKSYLSATLLALPALGSATANDHPDPFKVYNITAENITASFIGYGARLIALYVPDSNGTVQDVAVGYDDPKTYLHDTETNHTYFGATVGRYANRIKNGTFTIDGKTYHVPTNENGGADTLHGGFVGYDARNWSVTASAKDSITFSLLDSGFEKFPGDVLNHVTFTVDTEVTPLNPKGLPQLTSRIVSLSLTEKTPIMLANHVYWNLDAFQSPTILNDTLHMPLASRYVGGDSILIPNGTIIEVSDTPHGAIDYTTGKQVGQDFAYAEGICGFNCTGVDTCFVNDPEPFYPAGGLVPIIHLSSPFTGITLDVATNQPAQQIYTCNGQNGTIPIKASQKARNEAAGKGGVDYVNKWGCIVIETEGWIDAINQPEWAQHEIYAPGDVPTVNLATYQFGTI
ncbi:putative aldose 1-epimerase [Talaromyces proteolyticus]|uniref:Aldose 1-epimerase n=1 Tax=Talaromyces proteolyticus TaxID=1131652 RepID=A0AAD4PUS6_9EURO|nr:putative aldose 1-epimerase [Talaromyces proteolyticus]KAH8695441.1 putative aldose 1-epimerase [Talaromyces proteolyticus]